MKLPLPAPSTAASGPAAQADPAPETSELIDVVDAHGTVVWANGARSAALGYADGALSGVPARPLGAADRAGRITLAKLPLAARFERLEAENALLRKIDDTGNEAHWCIDLGVQWHPEYRAAENPDSVKLFTAFGEAARSHLRSSSR